MSAVAFPPVVRPCGGRIEGHSSNSSHKDELIKVVQQADEAAATLQRQAQQIVQDAALTRDMAQPLQRWACSQPDDSALSPQRWRDLNAAWAASRDGAYRLSGDLSHGTMFSGITASSALTTSVTVVVSDIINSPDIAQLNTVLARGSRFDEAMQALSGFKLNVGFTNSRSSTDLLNEAHEALVRPSGTDVAAASILIPARESIDSALAALLRRRPRQEEAKHKVVSIGGQCGRDGFDAAHFSRLESNLAALRTSLSEAKQQTMQRWEVSVVFNEVLLFLVAFLKSLDPAKLKP